MTYSKLNMFLLLSLLFTVNAWSRTSLLGLLKDGKNQYPINYRCINFVQNATKETLRSSAIQASLKSLKEVGINGDYFFHYSDDSGSHLKDAVKENNLKSVVEYLLIYSGARGNAMGGGMYVSANPFSSASYGSKQVILRLHPNVRIFDAENQLALVEEAKREIIKRDSNFAYCDAETQQTLIFTENDVDMVFYSNTKEWFVTLNEDVILETRFNTIGSNWEPTIIDKMMAQGNEDALIPLLDVRVRRSQSLSMEQFLAGLKNKPNGASPTLIKLMSTSTGKVYKALSKNAINSNTRPDAYFAIDLKLASSDYQEFISEQLGANPSLAEQWGDDLYLQNMIVLIKSEKMSIADYFTHAKSASLVLDLYRSRSSHGFSREGKNEIVKRTLLSPLLDGPIIKAQGLGLEIFAPALNDKSLLAELSLEDFKWITQQLVQDASEQNLNQMWNSGSLGFDQALILLDHLKKAQGQENLERLLKDYLDLKNLSTQDQLSLVSALTKNHSKLEPFLVNKLWSSFLEASESHKKLSPLAAFPSISSENKKLFLGPYVASRASFDEGIKIFSHANLQLASEVILSGDEGLISAITPYLETEYPRKKIIDYVYPLVMNYEVLSSMSSARNHMEQFICKKVNGYNAFDKLIRSRGSEKKDLKGLQARYCP